MHKIKEITLKNFKFFFDENKIDVDKKHILIYGENGSGKSSVFWALYTFLQSVFKNPADVQNYFNPRHDFSLVNRYANGDSSFIEVVFEDENQDLRTKRISSTTVNTIGDPFVESLSFSSDLIDYKSIFNIYNFTNRERLKLFKYFERHLMMFINFRIDLVDLNGGNNSSNAESWWKYIKQGLDPYPNIGGPGYWEFQGIVSAFNGELLFYLNSITETANHYLNEKFKENLRISFEYQPSIFNELVDGSRSRKTKAPEIFLNVTIIDDNISESHGTIYRSHTFLNEARLSSIALAIRMAILREKFIAGVPKVLILDDLLLSLDMGNREAVLNIVMEEYSQDYQIFFLTHDRQFYFSVLSYIKNHYSYLKKSSGELNQKTIEEAYKDNWKVLEMYESNLPDGKKVPVITEHLSHLQKALHYLKNIDNIDYNACGNNLRAALEEFFRGFIPSEFLRDGTGQLIDKNSLTLNTLIVKCINYFSQVGFNPAPLHKIDRYRERALNQTSHYNPRSNYFKKELEETLELINHFYRYKTEIIIKKDDLLNFTVNGQFGGVYIFNFKVLDDVRLYFAPEESVTSFYAENDKRIYAFTEFINDGISEPFNVITKSLTFKSFYLKTINELEKNTAEPCIRKANIFDELKNIDGSSLNQLKKY